MLLPAPTGTPGVSSTAASQSAVHNDNREETAAELAAPVPIRQNRMEERYDQREMDRDTAGGMLGFAGLALAILSLFIMPVILGAAGIIVGFLAMRRGATKSGGWAIGIGAISLIIGIFITPFF
ncbi:hypothetical protein DRW41_18220 [Neobacillus piezotolerans]|uniref:DUF4190 domain-containing protein n=1 Tax=Neobacillus piezotolerans TaxID=2259171 RepID=A0A3D8GLX0_9BACI|nr:hypothetical protein DRW41_18220 [Neobacillus piezotolerans]